MPKRTVEENLNAILHPISKHVAMPENFCISIGLCSIDGELPLAYYAVIQEGEQIALGGSSYGARSVAEAVAALVKEFHEYIDSLEDDDD